MAEITENSMNIYYNDNDIHQIKQFHFQMKHQHSNQLRLSFTQNSESYDSSDIDYREPSPLIKQLSIQEEIESFNIMIIG